MRQQKTNDENLLSPLVLSYSMEKTNSKVQEKWSGLELHALIDFVLFHSEENCWPAHKHKAFWNSASEYVHTRGAETMLLELGSDAMYYFAYNNFVFLVVLQRSIKPRDWLKQTTHSTNHLP